VNGSPITLTTASAEETAAVGRALGAWLREGDVVLLHGDLGAGKTTLAKGIAAQLRVDAVVASPSFALVNEYDTGLLAPVARLYHLDLYRLQNSEELATIGFADLSAPDDAVTLIEWPERAVDLLPARYLLIEFDYSGPDHRTIRISAHPHDQSWSSRMTDLRQHLSPYGSPSPSALGEGVRG
jgi:tRNA threonylcarbamoyladenosine biosynthesis protein TsaE